MPDITDVLAKEKAIAGHRMRRAEAMAEYFIAKSVRMLESLTDEEWQNLAAKSGINAEKPPSAETRGMVVSVLKGAGK